MAAVGLVGLGATPCGNTEPCVRGDACLAGVWNADRAARVRRALEATPKAAADSIGEADRRELRETLSAFSDMD